MNPSGVTPLLPVGDSVSIYEKADYENEIIDVFEKFSLSKPTLHRGLSTENKSVSFIESVSWDLIYIDGGHDYSVALHDYEVSKKSLKSGGLLVIDDSAKYTSYKPFSFSFGGHVGPSLVASLYADRELIKLCNVGHNSIYLKP